MIILIRVWKEYSSYYGLREMFTKFFHNNTQQTKETSYYDDLFLEEQIIKRWTRTRNTIRLTGYGEMRVRYDAIEYLNPIYEKIINLMFDK